MDLLRKDFAAKLGEAARGAAAAMDSFSVRWKALLFDSPELHRQLLRDLWREEFPESYAALSGEHQPRDTEGET